MRPVPTAHFHRPVRPLSTNQHQGELFFCMKRRSSCCIPWSCFAEGCRVNNYTSVDGCVTLAADNCDTSFLCTETYSRCLSSRPSNLMHTSLDFKSNTVVEEKGKPIVRMRGSLYVHLLEKHYRLCQEATRNASEK